MVFSGLEGEEADWQLMPMPVGYMGVLHGGARGILTWLWAADAKFGLTDGLTGTSG